MWIPLETPRQVENTNAWVPLPDILIQLIWGRAQELLVFFFFNLFFN